VVLAGAAAFEDIVRRDGVMTAGTDFRRLKTRRPVPRADRPEARPVEHPLDGRFCFFERSLIMTVSTVPVHPLGAAAEIRTCRTAYG
jgi:hypothetical protein